MFRQQKLWVSWQDHRRTESICSKLDIPLDVLKTEKKGLARYLSLSMRTLSLIKNKKPKHLIVQNPSLILSVLAVLFRNFFGYRLIVDAHNEGVEPYVNNSFIFRVLTKWLHRLADNTVVTNRQLAEIVEKNRGRPIILPDALPDLPIIERAKGSNSEEVRFTLIATFADDEPVEEILKAFSCLDEKVSLSVTGNYKKLDDRVRSLASNQVTFTGFLSEFDYLKLLNETDVIIDLTRMPFCLVCGAYEALALGKPMILTDDPAGRELFPKGVVFTGLNVSEIESSIRSARTTCDELAQKALEMKNIFLNDWIRRADSLKVILQ